MPPTLLSASFVGAGASPVSGDTLRLFLSEPVSLVNGASLSAADFDVQGGSLVATGSPSLLSAQVVEFTLGAGVAMTPGATTIDFGAGNDAVQDVGGQLAIADVPRTLLKADPDAPVITNLTLSDVDNFTNGTLVPGTLQVAQTGFTIDLAYTDPSGSVDESLTVIAANRAVVVGGMQIAAGENLTANFVATTAPGTASYAVPAAVEFPQGAVSITCTVADTTGQVSNSSSFSFLVRFRSDSVRLFETAVNPSQVWFIDVSRDIESFTVNLANTVTPVGVLGGANGRHDLEDLLRVLGLHSATPIPNVMGLKDSNEVVLDAIKAEVLSQLAGFYPGVNIMFTFTAPGVFPGVPTIGYNSFGFSQICLAGSATATGTSGVLGLAIFDPFNQVHEDNCQTNFTGNRLGVFLHTLINSGFLSGSLSQFRVTFDPFTPARSGAPIGDVVNDDLRLLGTLADARATSIAVAIRDLARFAALVVAHEVGHSLGLVENGAMPDGLFGGDSVNFPGSEDGHIVMPSVLFPGTSFNVMSPQISYFGALNPSSRFNTINLAYLREAVIYN